MKKTKSVKKARSTAAPLDAERVLARDLMRTDVLTLSVEDTVESAVELLEEYHVSGAPVIDDSGRPVGVFSSSDVARQEHVHDGHVDVERSGRAAPLDEETGSDFDEEVFPSEDYSPELLGQVRVGEWMTPRLLHVTPDATLVEVCKLMLAESIHRVFVVEEGAIRGVISTYDVVRLVAGEDPGGPRREG